MAGTFCFILVALAAVVLGVKSEALPKSRYSLIHAPSRVVASSTETPVFDSWVAGPAIGHDAAYGLEASPAATASAMSYDYDEGNGDRNRTLPRVLSLPAWLDAVNVAATKAWYTRKAICSQSEVINKIFSGWGTQSLAQQFATTTAGDRGDALLQPRSRRTRVNTTAWAEYTVIFAIDRHQDGLTRDKTPTGSATKDPVGSSPSKWRSSPVATQTLLALLGAVVTGSAVGGAFGVLVGAGVGATGGSTAKTYDKGEDRTKSTFDHLLKGCFLAAIIPVLFVWVFGRPG